MTQYNHLIPQQFLSTNSHLGLLCSFSDNSVYFLLLLEQGHSFDVKICHHHIIIPLHAICGSTSSNLFSLHAICCSDLYYLFGLTRT
jgi:hypothetical protein